MCDANSENKPTREITCDQVAWLLDVFDRYLPKKPTVRVSQEREMLKYGMLYEVMDVAGLEFADDSAVNNGTPRPVRIKSKADSIL